MFKFKTWTGAEYTLQEGRLSRLGEGTPGIPKFERECVTVVRAPRVGDTAVFRIKDERATGSHMIETSRVVDCITL